MIRENDYLSILRNFCEAPEEGREFTGKICIQDNLIFSGGLRSIAYIDKSLIGDIEFETAKNPPNLKIILDEMKFDLLATGIPCKELNEKCEELSLLLKSTYTVYEGNCPECDGSERVWFEYKDRNYKTYKEDFECPCCKDGKSMEYKKIAGGDIVETVFTSIQIGEANIRLEICQKMLEAAKLLECEWIELLRSGGNEVNHIFRIGPIHILTVPQIVNEEEEKDHLSVKI